MELRIERGGRREAEEASEREEVGFVEERDVAVDKAKNLEKEKGVGGEGDAQQRDEGDELVDVDEGPERLHGGLAEVSHAYRKHWRQEMPMRSAITEGAMILPAVSTAWTS